MKPQAPLLILDLDETLIHASEVDLAQGSDFVCAPYFIARRPGLTSFFERVQCRYRLAVWTSSTPDYLDCVLNNVLPIDFRLEFA